jgi:hypothetical protein
MRLTRDPQPFLTNIGRLALFLGEKNSWDSQKRAHLAINCRFKTYSIAHRRHQATGGDPFTGIPFPKKCKMLFIFLDAENADAKE